MIEDPGTSVEVAEEPLFLVHVGTGERLPATRDNAADVILAARERKHSLDLIIREAERFLADESRKQGIKTFHLESAKVVVSGGETTKYDPEILMKSLRDAECPEERIREVVKTEVEYKVNKTVLRQLTGANPAYALAAEKAAVKVEEPFRASVSPSTRR